MSAHRGCRALAYRHRAPSLFGLAAIVILLGCHSPASESSEKGDRLTQGDVVVPVKDDDPFARPYPKAHWRIAPPAALARVVLWVSCILIRHKGSDRQAPFSLGWNIEPPPPNRTRGEALTLARSLARRAAASPEQFSRLAQEYSEDVVTSATGGSIGAASEGTLLTEGSEILDALAATPQGNVTRVVETRRGFEILMRRRPPPKAFVAARVGVIPYEGAGGAFDPPAHPGRSRTEARDLARSLAEQLRAEPAGFDRFVVQYPAPRDAASDGNIGRWSTQEPGSWSREREQLASLPVGAISDPLEGPSGFALLMRTPADQPDYAMEVVEIGYSPNAPPAAPEGRDRALKLAGAMARSLASEPAQIGAFHKQYCCVGVEHWSEGRRPHDFIEAAANLPIGAVANQPLNAGNSFVIAKRVDGEAEAAPPLFDLPVPATASAAEFGAVGFNGGGVPAAIRSLGDEAAEKLHLAPADADRLKALHEKFSTAFDGQESPATREQALALFQQGLHSILSDSQYVKYGAIADERVATNLMKAW